MSSLNAVIFGAIAVVVVAGTDFAMVTQAKAKAGESYGLMAHIDARLGDMLDFMPGSKLAKALPTPREGWTVRVGTPQDSFLVTGLPIDPAQLAVMEAMEAKMVEAMPSMQMENRLYQNGDTAIYYGVSFLPASVKDAKVARVVTQMFSMFDSQATAVLNPVEGDYPLKKMTGPELGKAVLYYTQIDGQIFISALSNAGDEATLDLMTGVNKEALARLVAEDPTIGQETVGDAAEEKSDGCVQKGAAKFCSANN